MARSVEKIERLANLLFVLRDAKEPLTLVQIASQVPGYPAEAEARRTSFERDKRTLRESGIHITVSRPNSAAQDGYQILASDYYLPELNLSDAERNALRLALASVRFEGTVHAEIAVKIGAEPDASLPAVMELPREPHLGQLGEAIARRRQVRFSYHGRARDLEPGALYFHSGHWYLIGEELANGEGRSTRTYRVDRIEGALHIGEPDAYVAPEHSDLASELAFSLRSAIESGPSGALDTTTLRLLVEPSATASVIEVLGSGVVIERDEEGRAIVAFTIANWEAVVAFVRGLGAQGEVISPPEMRERVITELERFALEPPTDRSEFVAPPNAPAEPTPPRSARRSAIDAGARLRRMIAILTYLANEGSATVGELAERFDMPPSHVTSELELAACLGRPPYSPDELLEVIVIDDEVYVNQLEELEKPLRLTPDEGFALAAAARTLLQIEGVGGESPLATGLRRLEEVLGTHNLHIDVEIPATLEVLRRAAATNAKVEITYLGQSSGEATRRLVEPVALPFREGRFYLDAYCHMAGDWRRFALSNIADVTETGERGEPRNLPSAFLSNRAFVASKGATPVTIIANARHRYFLTAFADGEVVELPEDQILLTLTVGSKDWLGRLLLRLGDDADVVAPREFCDARNVVAAKALERYKITDNRE
jgi:proteasome accessory factor C